jgi:hypothetical protein
MKASCPNSTPTFEREERQRNVAARQADLGQRAGEAEAMQQPEVRKRTPLPKASVPSGCARRGAANDFTRQQQD